MVKVLLIITLVNILFFKLNSTQCFIVTTDMVKRSKKQSRNKVVSNVPELEPIPETEKVQQQVLMIEVENLKDEPYDKTMEIKVC